LRRPSSRRCSSRSRTARRRSTELSTRSQSFWDTIADEAGRESAIWADALRAEDEREPEPVFSPLGEERYALGLETIYEGYLVHYGRPRLFAPPDRDTALLLGDYLYAHGLVRVARQGSAEAVLDLAELISVCAQLRGDGADGDGIVWAASAAQLGAGGLEEGRAALRESGDLEPLAALARDASGVEPVERALAAHRLRVR
jgi:hypothetical protein